MVLLGERGLGERKVRRKFPTVCHVIKKIDIETWGMRSFFIDEGILREASERPEESLRANVWQV